MEYDLNDVILHLTLRSGTWEKEEKLKMISIHFKANRKKKNLDCYRVPYLYIL